jgi:REP element-mobilizing transposase RayT
MSYKKTRSPRHDYRSRSIYLITLNKAATTPELSQVYGNQQSPCLKITQTGRIVTEQLRQIQIEFLEAKILQYVVMPDHIHFVIFIQTPTHYHLGKLIGKFSGNCTRASDSDRQFFDPGFHDRILHIRAQLQSMIDYVRDNPRRLIIRREHRDFFTHGSFVSVEKIKYSAFGNFLLLQNPTKSAVKVSSKYTSDELCRRMELWDETIRENGVLVSPFISQAERQVRDKAIENDGSLIYITRDEITERYKPAGRLFDLCAQGRLLIISTYRPFQSYRISRKEAIDMNLLAAQIADPLPQM